MKQSDTVLTPLLSRGDVTHSHPLNLTEDVLCPDRLDTELTCEKPSMLTTPATPLCNCLSSLLDPELLSGDDDTAGGTMVKVMMPSFCEKMCTGLTSGGESFCDTDDGADSGTGFVITRSRSTGHGYI